MKTKEEKLIDASEIAKKIASAEGSSALVTAVWKLLKLERQLEEYGVPMPEGYGVRLS